MIGYILALVMNSNLEKLGLNLFSDLTHLENKIFNIYLENKRVDLLML